MLLLAYHLLHRDRRPRSATGGSVALGWVLGGIILFFAAAVCAPWYSWQALRALFEQEDTALRLILWSLFWFTALLVWWICGVGWFVILAFSVGVSSLAVYSHNRS